MSKGINYIVVFNDGNQRPCGVGKANSSATQQTRYYGPFVTLQSAYDFGSELPKPLGVDGFKFVHPMQPYTHSEARLAKEVILKSRSKT